VRKAVNSCIIGIGSNIDPQENIKKALDLLSTELKVVGISSFVRTRPLGITSQPDFLNGAAKVETAMEETEFRRYLKLLEDRLGRDRTQPKYGPRSIDLDIVIWNGTIVDGDYHQREFLRKSAAELGFRP
jgi:2-amino-4-hydroxy-6-hydroxymethyldihydropteridine diphosphokinase